MELLCEHYKIRNAALRTGIEKVVNHYFFSHAVKKCRYREDKKPYTPQLLSVCLV